MTDTRTTTNTTVPEWPDLDQIIPAHAPKFRIVTQQVGQLGSFLHEIEPRQIRDLVLKAGDPEHLAQYETRVVEAQRLIKVAHQQVMLPHPSSIFGFPHSTLAERVATGVKKRIAPASSRDAGARFTNNKYT